MPRSTPHHYPAKFAEFIRLCRKSQLDGTKRVIISPPSVNGDTYEEIIESLSRLAEAGLGLEIAKPEPGAPLASDEISRN